MYTTKRFHRNASLKFVSVGDPYEKKIKADSRTRGRQFQTRATPTHRTSDYFSQFKYPKGEEYHDRESYLEQQPMERRRLGFGSHDANKKGEFTTSCRTEQWKEHLGKERRLEKISQLKARQAAAKERAEKKQRAKGRKEQQPQSGDKLKDDLSSTASTCSTVSSSTATTSPARSIAQGEESDEESESEFFQCRVPRLLYDIGRTKNGVTPPCSQCPRDTFYCKHRAKISARFDPAKQESASIGASMRPSVLPKGTSATKTKIINRPPSVATKPKKPQSARPKSTKAVSTVAHHGALTDRTNARSSTMRPQTARVLSPRSMARVLHKPQFGRRSAVRDFYDSNHLHCN